MPDETHSTGEGPICPRCNTEYCADDPAYYDEDGLTEECPECGVMLHIQPYIETSWTIKVIDDE